VRITFAAVVVTVVIALVQASPAVTEGHLPMDDGVRIWHRSVGQGPETVIVPLLVLTSPHFDALATGRRVVYYDPRGRGRSDTGPLKDISLRRSLRDLDELRKHLGVERVALIGFSWYSLEVAQYALDYPGRVTRLVQLAPVPPRVSAETDSRGDAFQTRIDRAAWSEYERLRDSPPSDPRDRCRAFQRAIAAAVSRRPDRLDHAAVCSHPTEWPENQAPVWSALMRSAGTLDLRPRLPTLSMPRLIVRPDGDSIPIESVREWLEGTHVRLLTVPDAGHAAYLDRPDLVIPAIQMFLQGAWPAGSAE
jgi:proline iminopeptidase